jgi:hypothetical protein
MWALFGAFLLRIADALWFCYFYRRRAMFGAQIRWRWVEHLVPAVIGPEIYVSRAPKIAPADVGALPAVGALGFSRRATILLAVGAAMALVLLYQVIAERWLHIR